MKTQIKKILDYAKNHSNVILPILIITLIIVILILILVFRNGNSTTNTIETSTAAAIEETTVPDNLKEIDGYSYGTYEKYNSYAEDNGLGGNKIYITGTVKSVFSFDGFSAFSVLCDNGDRWLVHISDGKTVLNDKTEMLIDEQKITCFGIYTGYSDVFLIPAMKMNKVEVGEHTYKTDDFIEQETTEPQTTEKATEPPTEKPTEITDGLTKLYSDDRIDVYFKDAELYKYSTDEVNVHFLIKNKTDVQQHWQADTVILDGVSYNDVVMSDPVSANSYGVIEISVDDCSNSNPSTVGADLRCYFGQDVINNEMLNVNIISQNVK